MKTPDTAVSRRTAVSKAEEEGNSVSVPFQKDLAVTVSCAPIKPACPPPPTATASRIVRTAATSATAVSEGRFGEEAPASGAKTCGRSSRP